MEKHSLMQNWYLSKLVLIFILSIFFAGAIYTPYNNKNLTRSHCFIKAMTSFDFYFCAERDHKFENGEQKMFNYVLVAANAPTIALSICSAESNECIELKGSHLNNKENRFLFAAELPEIIRKIIAEDNLIYFKVNSKKIVFSAEESKQIKFLSILEL